MQGTVLSLLDMMRLRSGPQDMPAGRLLTLFFAIAYLAQGFFADRILDSSETAPRSMVSILVQFAIIASILNIKGLASRINQTISALAGTGFLFGMISIALLTRIDLGKPQPILALLYLLLFLWSLAVDANIYRHALSIKMSSGVLMAVMIFLANFVILRTVFA